MSDIKAKKEMAQEILLEFACSVCQDVPGPVGVRKNRYACSNGHMVCDECKIHECTCKSMTFGGSLNFIEKVLDKLQWHYCSHFKQGCRDLVEARNLEDHQRYEDHVKTCIFRKINCPDFDCENQVLFKDINDHIINDHKDWSNIATKIDAKTFKVAYDKKVVGIIETAVNDDGNKGMDGKANAAIPEGTVYTTPSRFGFRFGFVWSDGGSDDSICFSVGTEDIFIAGFCVFGGPSTTCYEAEMSNGDVKLFQRLNGNFAANDCVDGIFTVKFDKTILLRPHSKYTLRWKNHSQTTDSGKEGIPLITGPDGTKFKYEIDPKGSNKRIDYGQLFQILYFNKRKIMQLPSFDSELSGVAKSFGSPIKLETTDGRIFFLVGRKQYDTLRFWIYILASSGESNHYSYNLSITKNSGDEEQTFKGKLFTLDLNEATEGSVFIMDTKIAQRICNEDSKLNFNIVIRNLKEEAKDDDVESGVDEGED